ncbi:hypothetical protein F1640_18590 [Novosphingobium sp. NBM11]|uniref:hypothetical protein n=1 Tax=Novosphingobium sp. NBM11 TaxID=2596914 RepID=UPI0018927F29|nr:hypothetical protein [Novosphingobium sp. NBM11]MBF5091964.1 hypothetical protein [Novosphingobium sp. NBM11]
MTTETKRDRSQVNSHEKLFQMYQRITQARRDETLRVAGLIELALYEAESEETQAALVDLAYKVLKP